MALVEAMAHGIPVIGTRTGGLPELLDRLGRGAGGARRSGRAGRRGGGKYWARPLSGSRLGAAGRRRVEEEFDARRYRSATGGLVRRRCPDRAGGLGMRNVLIVTRNFAPTSHVSVERALKLASTCPSSAGSRPF